MRAVRSTTRDRHARVADAVAQLGREVPLDLLAAEVLDAGQDAPNDDFRSRLGKQCEAWRDPIARVTLAKMHLPGAAVGACGRQRQFLAQRPEAQQADPELALQASRALRLETPLDRIADVRRDVVEVRHAARVPAHALAVILDAQVMPALSLPRVMTIVFACASMLFSTSSATAFNGLLCDSAMIVIAFQ